MLGPKVTVELKVSDAMLHAAMKKAVELGLFPKHADMETKAKNWERLKAVLQTAVEA